MRRSSWALLALAVGLTAFAGTFLAAAQGRAAARDAIESRARLAADLGLTDLCLFTEARYTRHPSQADLHSAFQDHPLALDHFPSGALMGPPPHLTGHD